MPPLALLLAALLPLVPVAAQPVASRPLVIAHRGASGYLPEHTLAGYSMAIEQGADFIEPDLVMTKDAVLVARHENDISATTNVADIPAFAARKTTKQIDGAAVTGWFTEDFTLVELKTLRAKERIPRIRPANTRFDGMYAVATFEEILTLLARVNTARASSGKPPVGVYPETKHPSYFAGIGLAMEQPLVDMLHRYGYRERNSPAFIQSFEVGNLKRLAGMTRLPLVQLMDASARPYDFVAAGDKRGYADLAAPAGLAAIASYAQAIGASKNMIIPRSKDDGLLAPTRLIEHAHAAGLKVHAWTFRAENAFLPLEFRSSKDQSERGDVLAEMRRFLALGLDGLFIDHPDLGAQVRDAAR